ncbi:hypothetical protein [Thioalkalivibrio sp.]|uniref:hypothetical protein n=1 Tax=Thioalkalivibrio sp. TaxID=2093813 RepID=UPI003561C349
MYDGFDEDLNHPLDDPPVHLEGYYARQTWREIAPLATVCGLLTAETEALLELACYADEVAVMGILHHLADDEAGRSIQRQQVRELAEFQMRLLREFKIARPTFCGLLYTV